MIRHVSCLPVIKQAPGWASRTPSTLCMQSLVLLSRLKQCEALHSHLPQDDAEGVQVRLLRQLALAQQLRRHVRHLLQTSSGPAFKPQRDNDDV